MARILLHHSVPFYYVTYHVPIRLSAEQRESLEDSVENCLDGIHDKFHQPQPEFGGSRFIATDRSIDQIAGKMREILAPSGSYCVIARHDTNNFRCYPEAHGQSISRIPKVEMQHAILRIQELFEEQG